MANTETTPTTGDRKDASEKAYAERNQIQRALMEDAKAHREAGMDWVDQYAQHFSEIFDAEAQAWLVKWREEPEQTLIEIKNKLYH